MVIPNIKISKDINKLYNINSEYKKYKIIWVIIYKMLIVRIYNNRIILILIQKYIKLIINKSYTNNRKIDK